MLPFPKKHLDEISSFVSEHVDSLTNYQEELDDLVFKAYGLSLEEIDFIKKQ